MYEEQLSEREQDILRLLASAKSNKEIALDLGISVNTVKVHVANIYQKINVSSRTEAALYAIKTNMIGTSEVLDEKPVEGVLETPRSENTQKNRLKSGPKLMRVSFVALALLLITISVFRIYQKKQTPVSFEGPYWQKLDPMPVARSRFGSINYGDEIYLISGETPNEITNRVDVYSSLNKTWQNALSKPTAVRNISAVVIEDKIYVAGGEDKFGHFTNKLEVFDPSTNSWVQKAPLPIALSSYSAVAYRGNLYLFGGLTPNGITNAVYKYYPQKDEWLLVSETPVKVSNAAIVEYHNQIFLFCGSAGTEFDSTIQVFNPGNEGSHDKAWSQSSELPSSFDWVNAHVLGDIIFLFGNNRKGETELLQFSSAQSEWISTMAHPPQAIGAYSNSVVSGGNILFFGGEDIRTGISDSFLKYQGVFQISIPNINK